MQKRTLDNNIDTFEPTRKRRTVTTIQTVTTITTEEEIDSNGQVVHREVRAYFEIH